VTIVRETTPPPLTADQLDVIRCRAAATPGPWTADEDDGRTFQQPAWEITSEADGVIARVRDWLRPDAEFIAAAREDVSALLDDSARLRARVAELERERTELNEMIRSSNAAAVTARREMERRPSRAAVLREAADRLNSACPDGSTPELDLCHCHTADVFRHWADATEGDGA
jgi:hypothetical protein